MSKERLSSLECLEPTVQSSLVHPKCLAAKVIFKTWSNTALTTIFQRYWRSSRGNFRLLFVFITIGKYELVFYLALTTPASNFCQIPLPTQKYSTHL